MRKNSFTCPDGFSLIELLISIAILAILLINAPPSYIKWYQQTKLKNTVSDLTLLLHQAQRTAVTENQPAYVIFSGVNNARMTLTTFVDCVSQQDCPTSQISKQLLISEPVELETTSFPHTYIRFAPSTGLADGMAGTFTLRANDFRIKLIVSRLGRIRTCAPDTGIAGIPLC